MSEEKIEYKVSVPLFEKGELETFDNHIHEIVEEYSKLVLKEKEQILTQRIIMKQEEEIERLNKQLQLISDEFLKYDWENSSKEQIINQLKSLYNSIFKGSDK